MQTRRAFLSPSTERARWSGAHSAERRPNILFVFTDDHAVRSIGAYGSKINRTPNLDRIAREGAVFLGTTCANSICAPSRATVLTGKHSHANGQFTNLEVFDGSQTTFPKLLQEAGYQTALIGKWHLESDPTGFDHWEVLSGQGNYYNPDLYGRAGSKRYPGYATDIVTDLCLDWLRRDRDEERPFLLMCQHKAPHRPWVPGPDHLTLYDDDEIPEPPTLFDDYARRAPILSENEMTLDRHMVWPYDLKIEGTGRKDALGRDFGNNELPRMTPEQWACWDAAYGPKNRAFLEHPPVGDELVRWIYQRYIKDYLRCIASVDDNVGRLLAYLDETGLAQDTLVVYSSDHGFFLGEHGMYDKRWMYEESMQIPLLARWPGRIAPGTRIEALTQNIDFAPSFLEAAGVAVPHDMHGCSLVPLFGGDVPPGWRTAVYYHYYEVGEHNVARHEGVRTHRYKLIHYYDLDQWELFDLGSDPHEMRSVYEESEYAPILAEMEAMLHHLRQSYAVPARDALPDPVL